jgi:hypothetical protein
LLQNTDWADTAEGKSEVKHLHPKMVGSSMDTQQKSDKLCVRCRLSQKKSVVRLVTINLRQRWAVPVHPQRLGYSADLKLYCGLAFAALPTKRRWHISENYGTQLVFYRRKAIMVAEDSGSRIREQRELGRHRC